MTSVMDWPEAAVKGEWIAGGVNAVLISVLIATRRWWRWNADLASARASTDRQEAGTADRPAALIIPPLLWYGLLVFILGLAGAMRWQFAHGSLWWDEVWNVRNATVGKFLPDKKRPDEFRFVRSSWAQALWNYRKPTNHPPFTLLSKVCHQTRAA